jgi:hypothetical protein
MLFGAAVGFLVGCFTPAVCAKVKAYLTAEAKVAATDAQAELKKIAPKA